MRPLEAPWVKGEDMNEAGVPVRGGWVVAGRLFVDLKSPVVDGPEKVLRSNSCDKPGPAFGVV